MEYLSTNKRRKMHTFALCPIITTCSCYLSPSQPPVRLIVTNKEQDGSPSSRHRYLVVVGKKLVVFFAEGSEFVAHDDVRTSLLGGTRVAGLCWSSRWGLGRRQSCKGSCTAGRVLEHGGGPCQSCKEVSS